MASIQDIEEIKIKDLKKYANNSKKHPEKQLKILMKSISKFGFLTPCLVDQDNNLIAGHGRVEAAERLKMESVPCVRIEGLTEEERKAYIIADNKLTELGGWDKDLVAAELSMLDSFNFDIDVTGFTIQDINEILYKPEKAYGAEKYRTAETYNLDKMNRVELEENENYWEMPVIKKDDFIPTKLIGFNYAKTSKEKNATIHFYLDDYQFERIWNDPDKYIDVLEQYECVLSPEFSLYWDMPLPMQIWNTYRNRFIGSYLQQFGIKVIPSIVWADEKSFDFCFLGVEKGSIVAVETNGVKQNKEITSRWQRGMQELIKRIEPSVICVYGGQVDFDYGDIKVIYYENQVLKGWKKKNDS